MRALLQLVAISAWGFGLGKSSGGSNDAIYYAQNNMAWNDSVSSLLRDGNTAGSADVIAYWQAYIKDAPGPYIGGMAYPMHLVQMALHPYQLLEIDTAKSTLTIELGLMFYWNATWTGCAKSDSYSFVAFNPDSRADTCSYSFTNACFAHPPLVTAKQLSDSMPSSSHSAMVPCELGVSNEYVIKSFEDQFWRPRILVRNQVFKDRRPGGELWLSRPFGKGTGGPTRVWLSENFLTKVKVSMDLHKYPFDSQALRLWIDPVTASPIELGYDMQDYIYDEYNTAWGEKHAHTTPLSFQTAGLAKQMIGKTRSGFTVTDVTSGCSNSSTPQGTTYKGCYLDIHVDREPATVIYAIMLPVFLIQVASYCLFFTDPSIHPAAAGCVVSSVVLLLITNNILSAALVSLPSGATNTYLTYSIVSSMGVQMVQLPLHLWRMTLMKHQENDHLQLVSLGCQTLPIAVVLALQGLLALSFEIHALAGGLTLSLAAVMAMISGGLIRRAHVKYLRKQMDQTAGASEQSSPVAESASGDKDSEDQDMDESQVHYAKEDRARPSVGLTALGIGSPSAHGLRERPQIQM